MQSQKKALSGLEIKAAGFEKLERKHDKLAQKQLNKESRAFIKSIKENGISVETQVNAVAQAPEWEKFAEDAQVDGVKVGGKAEIANAKSQVGAFETKATAAEIITDLAAEYAAQNAVLAASLISETSLKTARLLAEKAILEGWSVSQFAKNARLFHLTTSKSRALTIARTELLGAMNAGQQGAADSTGLEYEKEWSSAFTATTRQSHADADGQRVKQGESFNIGGELLQHPGDSSASAANRINCLCAMEMHYN